MKWPKTTPTGHTYTEPRTYAELLHEHSNAAHAAIECWEEDECPPEPTWEMVGIAHREVERLQRDLDEWKARAIEAEQSVDPDPVEAAIRDGLSVWGTTDKGVREIAESVRRAIGQDGRKNAV